MSRILCKTLTIKTIWPVKVTGTVARWNARSTYSRVAESLQPRAESCTSQQTCAKQYSCKLCALVGCIICCTAWKINVLFYCSHTFTGTAKVVICHFPNGNSMVTFTLMAELVGGVGASNISTELNVSTHWNKTQSHTSFNDWQQKVNTATNKLTIHINTIYKK